MSRGIDVSHHQTAIDWHKAKAGGVEWAIIRAGRDCTVDRRFHEHIKGAMEAGLPVGVYWFSYALNAADAVKEANFCMDTIKPYKLDLPVFCDYEYDSERYAGDQRVVVTKRLRTDIIKAFCQQIAKRGGVPAIYTNGDYIKNRLFWNELKHYPLWLAQFPLGEKDVGWTALKPEYVSTKYGKPMIWQFGQAKVDGYKLPVDANFGYMTLPDKQPAPAPVPVAPAFKIGDKVEVINTTKVLGLRRGKLYGGGTFVVYRDSYDVISISGKRVVIGVGNAVTAAVNADDLKKL